MKSFLWIAAGLVAGALLFGMAVALLFNADSFRQMIGAEVERATQRKLSIGEIHIGLFPTPGAHIRNVSLSNAPGFGDEPMAWAGEAQVGLRLIPLLLHRRAEISSIAVQGLHLDLVRQADGRSNWDDLGGAPPQPAQGQPSAAPRRGAPHFPEISSVDLEDAGISYTDQPANKSYALSKISLHTSAIAPGRPFDFKLAFSAAVIDPALSMDVQASASFDPSAPDRQFDIRNLVSLIAVAGQGVPGGRQELQLGGSVHYDRGLGAFKLSDGKLVLGNISAAIALDGSGLGGDAAHLGGSVDIAPFNPRDTLKALGLEAPQMADGTALQQASFKATLNAAKGSASLDGLSLRLDQSTFSGGAGLVNSGGVAMLQFALKLDQIDADRYLAPARRNPLAPRPGGKPGEGDNAPLPLDRLDAYNLGGTVEIDKLKLKNLHLANARLKLAAVRGAAKTIDLTANLYGGTLVSATRIGVGARPALAQTLKLDSISAAPLLQDLTGKSDVSGVGSLSLELTSSGSNVNELKRGLDGSASFALRDGAVKGFNLGQVIRRAQTFSGGGAEQQTAPQQTDYTSLSASGTFHNGVFRSDNLSAASPLLRLTGAGQVDVGGNTIDYIARPELVNTASGQDGKELSKLRGIVIPVHIFGPLDAPRYKIDLASVLRQSPVQKLEQKLEHNGGELGKIFRGLFGKKKQDQQSPQDPPPSPPEP
jgi:AsmA protein